MLGLLPLLSACSTSYDTCADPDRSDVPECAGSFCYDRVMHVEARSDEGAATLESSFQEGVYQAYSLRTEGLFLYVSFEPSVAHDQSARALEEGFKYVWFELDFPDRRDDRVHLQTDALHRGAPELEALSFADGVVTLELQPAPVTRASYDVESRDDDCISEGDILGRCACRFTLEPVQLSVRAVLKLSDARPE